MTKKITDLDPALPLTGAEIVPLVQNVVTRRSPLSALADWLIGVYPGFLPAGAGAVPANVQNKLQQVIHVSDYSTKSAAFANAGKKIIHDTTTGQLWGTTDSSPLNYQDTRAGLVWQHRDTTDASANELVPGIVFQFNATGNGSVNAGIEQSSTIWQGQFNFMNKTGDGSAHTFTAIGQLGVVGPGGYNELGMYQGELTNTGSILGTMSGVEMLLKDSPDGGVNSYSTKMQGVVSRIAKHNPTTRKSFNFWASCEGTRAIDAVLGINRGGFRSWLYGIDLSEGLFTTGNTLLSPNNTALAWMDATLAARPILGVADNNIAYLRPASAAAYVDLQDFSGTSRLQVTGDGINFSNATLGASASAGTNGASPAQVAGYMMVKINGSDVKIPYYNI